MSNYNYNILCHHGIKGQKWGIRRYQNEDGSLTVEGRKRYGVGSNGKMSEEGKKLFKSDTKEAKGQTKTYTAFKTQKLEKYINQGLTIEEANKRYNTRKTAAIVGSAVAAATAAYATYKLVDYNKGQTLKKGAEIQRIAPSTENGLHREFYAANNKKDKSRYQKLLPYHYLSQQDNDSVVKTIKVNDNIKVASDRKAKQIYKQMVKAGEISADESYNKFNANLVSRNKDSMKFYKKLQDAGYGAVRDVNDRKYSGYRAKNPLILFGDSSSKVSVIGQKAIKLSDDVVRDMYVKEAMKAIGENVVSSSAKIGVVGAGAYATKKYLSTIIKRR